jgi:hypoxia up-regulated 1
LYKVRTTLFDQFSPIGERKTFELAHNGDINFSVMYKEDAGNGIMDIAKVKITGVKEATKQHPDDDLTNQKAHVVFEMSNSGILSVPEAYFEIAKRSFIGK